MSTRNNQEQTNPSGYEFVKSKQQDVIICPDGRRFKVEADAAINVLLEESTQQPFHKHIFNVANFKHVLLDADMPDYLSVKEYQEFLRSYELVIAFVENIFVKEEGNA